MSKKTWINDYQLINLTLTTFLVIQGRYMHLDKLAQKSLHCHYHQKSYGGWEVGVAWFLVWHQQVKKKTQTFEAVMENFEWNGKTERMMQKITYLNFHTLDHQRLYWRKISKFTLTKCILLITEKIQTECKVSN